MKKVTNISITLSFIGLWIASLFSGNFEIILGFVLIFTFGILHGSNDILLIRSISKTKTNQSFLRVLGIYLSTVSLSVITFYLIPILALSLFVILSAFHFGEQHWEDKKLELSDFFSKTFYLVYGMLVLSILFAVNAKDVIEVVLAITSLPISFNHLVYIFMISLIIFVIATFRIIKRNKKHKPIIINELFYLLILFVIFKVSTLIWGFTIYFIFWHSIPSLYFQVKFIYGTFDKHSFFKYCKNAFPYWLISLIGIATVYLLFNDNSILYGLFFSFIASLTFPHAFVITKMFNNKKT